MHLNYLKLVNGVPTTPPAWTLDDKVMPAEAGVTWKACDTDVSCNKCILPSLLNGEVAMDNSAHAAHA